MAKKEAPVENKPHHDKKKTLLKGMGMNLLGYILLAAILLLLGVPSNIVFMIMTILLFGLLILGYTFYYHK